MIQLMLEKIFFRNLTLQYLKVNSEDFGVEPKNQQVKNFGGTFVALYRRLGGSIYTEAPMSG